jgi:hypothetical protein
VAGRSAAAARVLRGCSLIVPAILIVVGIVTLLNPPDDAASQRDMTIIVSVALGVLVSWLGLRAFASWVENSASEALASGRAQVSQTARQTADHLMAVREGRYFAGVLIDGDALVVDRKRHPLAGASARVESGGQITQRLSATRMVLLNVFALAAPKKKDRRETYLAIEGPTFSLVVPVNPDQSRAAHVFAARITDAGKRVDALTNATASTPMATSASPSGTGTAAADEVDAIALALERAQRLHATGAISDEEYSEMRREILRRV